MQDLNLKETAITTFIKKIQWLSPGYLSKNIVIINDFNKFSKLSYKGTIKKIVMYFCYSLLFKYLGNYEVF